MKKFLAKISDIKNAMRVLEIMDECGCDIEKVEDLNGDYWRIKPKWYVSEKDAKDLQTIILHNQHYCHRSKIWKFIFPNIRDGYRFRFLYRKYRQLKLIKE